MPPTVILRDALLPSGRSVDIVIVDGVIESTGPANDGTVRSNPDVEVHQLDGRLVLPTMVEPHAHLDKALTAEAVPNPTGDLYGAIDAWTSAARTGMFTDDDIESRATAAIELLVQSGVTAVRTHVNVGASNGSSAVRAVRAARSRLEGLVDVQIVALTSSPMVGPDGAGNRAALAAALVEGVDLVGGCPHLEHDGASMIAGAIAAATEAGIGLDLHVDETLDPTLATLRELARQVGESGFPHPVTASHCVSLGMQSPELQRATAEEVAAAGVAVVTLPQTNLFLQGRDQPTATPRGLTAIAALREAGVRVAAGADNVQDPFNLVGRSDPLETAALLVMAGHVLPDEAYSMVSHEARAVLGLAPVSVSAGAPADLVAIRAPSTRGAIAQAPNDRMVFRSGRLIARSTETRQILHG